MTQPDTLAKLAACPFCGGQPRKKTDSLDERYSYANRIIYECMGCGCSRGAMGDTSKPGYADNSTTEARALEAWNRRALTAQALPAAPEPAYVTLGPLMRAAASMMRLMRPQTTEAAKVANDLAAAADGLYITAGQPSAQWLAVGDVAAQQAAQASAVWQPMATIPRDGKEFLAAIEVHNVVTEARWWETHSLILDDDGDIDADRFTGWEIEDYAGWQHPPAPPTALPLPPQPQEDAA